MRSVWDIARDPAQRFPSLEGDIDVDVAVIGAGMTGLVTALRLAEAGRTVAVLEASRVGDGDTGGSTGNLYATKAGGLMPVLRKWNDEVVRQVVNARREAIDTIADHVSRFNIDCGFQRGPLYRVLVEPDDAEARVLEQERDLLRGVGLAASLVDAIPGLPTRMHRALLIEGQAQYNPIAYVQGLAKAVAELGVSVYEQSRVVEADGGKQMVRTERGQVRAAAIVHATHTPKGVSLLHAQMEPFLEYGISARLEGDAVYPDGTYWVQDRFHSLRNYRYEGQDYLVVVGHRHKTGSAEPGLDYYEALRDYLQARFPIASFEHAWSAQQFTPADELPYIGAMPTKRNEYVGTGYAADGLVWGVIAGEIIADQISGRETALGQLFSPRRFTPAKSAKKWFEAGKTMTEHFIKGRLSSAERESVEGVPRGEGRIVSLQGEKTAVYRDDDGQAFVLSPICPHMKCTVNWNRTARTWDCPCHGSRFAPNGQVIEGPSYDSLAQRAP